jgi:DNA repair protein RecN (Recombination protein N)
MLQNLDIRDFVIVKQLELDLSNGFTVLTGETGAGKSILLDALGIAMGEKADSSLIRESCTRASICANFYITPSLQATINPWLTNADFPLEEAGSALQIKRTIESSGRSKAYINGHPATLQQLRDLGEQLVDIHGQHEHQLLLKPGAQRMLLDRHANLTDLQEEVASEYKAWQAAEKTLKVARTAGQNLAKEKERLEWQLEELNALAPKLGEWDEIQIEHSRLANASELIEGSQSLVELLSDGEQALLDQLAKAEQLLTQLTRLDGALESARAALEPASIQINEAVHTVNRYLQKLELDPERLGIVESRLQEYFRLAKKLHCQPADLPNTWEELKEELRSLEAAQNIEAIEKEVARTLASYTQSAKKLSQARLKAATKLSEEVSLAMQDLAMSGGKFVVELITLEQGNQYGLENVEFLVAGHPGVQPRPISKVASGGELARISLAIAVIASSASSVPTLIFDEVDSGIGGAVAQTVGSLLRKLGKSHQVLCVTHLPQVAAQGDQQWRVQKIIHDNQTVSDIQVLGRQERIQEVARMLGGATITDTTLRHARELLETS